MPKQSELEKIAIEVRKEIIAKNDFNNYSTDHNYSATHTKAKSDDETPRHGKGTGVYMDTENGGSSEDTHGVVSSVGSGRIGNVTNNEYNKDKGYETPDTSGNIGQVRL